MRIVSFSLLFLIAVQIKTADPAGELTEAQDEQDLQSDVQDTPSAVSGNSSSTTIVNDKIAGNAKYIKIQPPWIDANKFDVQLIVGGFPAQITDYVTYEFGSFDAKNGEKFKVTGIKASRWCFLKFEGSVTNKYFFECLKKQLGETIYLRPVSPDCPYPEKQEPTPPIADVCYMHYKKGQDTVTSLVQAVGQGDAEKIIECYLEAVVKTVEPDVPIMCSEQAFVEGWTGLSGQTYEDFKKNLALKDTQGLNMTFAGTTSQVNQVVGQKAGLAKASPLPADKGKKRPEKVPEHVMVKDTGVTKKDVQQQTNGKIEKPEKVEKNAKAAVNEKPAVNDKGAKVDKPAEKGGKDQKEQPKDPKEKQK